MLNDKAEGFRAIIRAARDRLRHAWDLNLPKGEVQTLQDTLHKAQLGLRRMGLSEDRREGTLMKHRKPRKSKAIPAEDAEAPKPVPAVDETPST